MMQLTKTNIETYAARYDAQASKKDKTIEKSMKRALVHQRFLTKRQLRKLGAWKSSRPKKFYARNDKAAVQELTAFSFSAKSEQARIGCLRILEGVDFPVASVILHFAFPQHYPILDDRARWSLGWPKPKTYTLKFWNRYCSRIRKLALRLNLPIRTIDKALWQYSREHQKK